jgi:hypothetical protein
MHSEGDFTMRPTWIVDVLAGCILSLAATTALVAAEPAGMGQPKSPDAVQMGLHILAAVYGDMERKLAGEQFDRLPHENQEFQEGSQAMRDAVASESPGFKARVEKALKQTLADSNHVADESKSHDRARVRAAIDTLADSLRKLNALFPEGLRAEPGTVEPPHH